jgi:hypothetical protein
MMGRTQHTQKEYINVDPKWRDPFAEKMYIKGPFTDTIQISAIKAYGSNKD